MPNKQESICVQLKLCPTILKAINNSSHLFDRINGHLDMYRCKKNDVQVSLHVFKMHNIKYFKIQHFFRNCTVALILLKTTRTILKDYRPYLSQGSPQPHLHEEK